MGSNSTIKRRLSPHTLPGFLLTVWLLVSLSTSQAVAVTVPEADAEPQREGLVLPALGISETFGRWTDVIRLGYNPTGAIPAFANTQQFLTILSDAANIWERVSGVRFEILPAGNYPADHNNAQSSRDGIVNVFWASSAGSFAAQAGPRAGSYNEAEGYFPYTDGFVWLNSSCTSATCVSGMTSVLVHELGHLLGLGHSDTPDSIMFANPYTFLRNPRKDDIRAVQTLYGGPTTAFDAGKPLDEWLFVKPPLASTTKTQFLFKDNQNSRVNSDAMLVFSSQQQFDEALPPITASTPDDVWIRIFAPLGNFNNQIDIEIPAQVVVVDPSGYEYRRDNWQLSCRARNACFATFNFLQTSVAKFIPGRWQVYVVENAEQVASPELLLSLSFDVLTTPAFNNPPMANVDIVAGETPGTVRMRIIASDLERHRLSAVWHLPGQRLDRDGDRFLDNELTEVLGTSNVGNWQTINFGGSGAKRLFVQVNDNGPRYGGQFGGLSDAGGGFQTLLRIDLQLDNNVPGAVTLASSAVHQYRPSADWPYPFPGVTPAAAINSPFNTIGELTEANMTIQSCVRILNAGQPATVDGLSHIDLGFVITDMAQGIIQIVKSRGFNQSATPTAQGEQPVCSGEFEASTGMYKDVIQVGAQTFETLFQLIDEPNLRLMLRDAKVLGQ